MASTVHNVEQPTRGLAAPTSDVVPNIDELLAQVELEHARGEQGTLSRIPQGARVRIELTSNGGRYFIYRYKDYVTGKRKSIYGGKSSTLGQERLARYEQRSAKYKAKG